MQKKTCIQSTCVSLLLEKKQKVAKSMSPIIGGQLLTLLAERC